MAVSALYAGTFDPFTNGHLDIAKRALKVFSPLTILVALPPQKTPFLDAKTRVGIISEIFAKEKNVRVIGWDRLVVDFARENDIKVIVRGLRPTGDFDSEFQMATMNRNLDSDIETVFITTSSHSYYVSSSLVREVFLHGGDVQSFVPQHFIPEFLFC